MHVMEAYRGVLRVAREVVWARAFIAGLLVAAVLLGAQVAHATPTLPDIGIDLTDYIALFAGGLAAVLAIVITYRLAFMIVRAGMRYFFSVG